MRTRSCCVVNCKNNKKNCTNVQFYSFPVASHKREQRRRWINAVRRQNPDGSKWESTDKHLICSTHFIGDAKSDNQYSPSYIPTIFPDVYKSRLINENAPLQRHERFMKRRSKAKEVVNTMECEEIIVEEQADEVIDSNTVIIMEVEKISQECQVDFLPIFKEPSKTFVCNKYYFANNKFCDAETQTEISEPQRIIIPNRLQFSDKQCGPSITYEDKCVECNSEKIEEKGFLGIESIKNDDQLIELCGVTRSTFQLFVDKLVPNVDYTKISKENRLFIFFTKMKTGLTYSALSVIFKVHRTTISRIFIETLQYLSSALRNCIKWFDKDCVQAMIPESFKPKYSKVPIIIDCTEFPIEIPSGIDNCVYTYSHYKKGFTAKVLIECTPNGLITFKSACAGGRKSDSQITIESGLLDLQENDDVILADKGFPEIRTQINEKGKKILVVMPPFLTNPEFTKEENEETYSVANVRIHIERIMQRIKLYNILNKIPANLFYYIDDILHVCCVLVNLQPPIIAAKKI